MAAKWLAALAVLALSSTAALADSKESALSTVTPGGNDTVTGLQAGANVNFTTTAIAKIMSDAGLLTTGTMTAGRFPAFAGDCTTSAGAVSLTCTKTNGVAFGTAATANTGTSGATVPLLNGNNTYSGSATLNGAVSGTGVTNLFASPPAIGGSAPAAGNFTTLGATGNLTTNVTGSTQCLHANTSGVVSGTGSDCGSGGGGSSVTVTDNTTTATAGTITMTGGLFVSTTGSGQVTVQTGTTERTVSTSTSFAASDMGGIINLNGGSGQTLTVPGISATIFPLKVQSCFQNQGTTTWTLSITPVINGFNGTSIPPGVGGCLVSNGTSLDFQTGSQPATSTVAGVFQSKNCSGGGQFVQSLNTDTTVTCGTPAGGGNVSAAANLSSGLIVIGQGTQAVAVDTNASLTLGALALGTAGSQAGSVALAGSTSGVQTIIVPAISSTGTIAIPPHGTSADTFGLLNVNQAWGAGQAVTPDSGLSCGTQTSGGTLTPNFANSNSCLATFGPGNFTIANPSNLKAGQSYIFALTQSATGSGLITAWGGNYKFAGGITPTLTTTAGGKDIVSCFADTTSSINCVGAVLNAK